MLRILVVAALTDAPRERALFHLQLGLERAAIVRHDIQPIEGTQGGLISHVVADETGTVWADERELEHACLTCAVRLDIVPVLERVAADGRWDVAVVALPLAANPEALVWELHRAIGKGLRARVCTVISAVDAECALGDVFGDETLAELDLHVSESDERSVGEALCAQIEYADVVTCLDGDEPEGEGLVRALADPRALVLASLDDLDAAALLEHDHCLRTARRRVDPVELPSPASDCEGVVTRVLETDRAFHPGRLQAQLEDIGAGELRSRGCFWLPTRPEMVCAWDGSGGQVSIGDAGRWRGRSRRTRLVLVSPDIKTLDRAERAFRDCLLTDFETRQASWPAVDDGFEPWLGVYDLRSA